MVISDKRKSQIRSTVKNYVFGEGYCENKDVWATKYKPSSERSGFKLVVLRRKGAALVTTDGGGRAANEEKGRDDLVF